MSAFKNISTCHQQTIIVVLVIITVGVFSNCGPGKKDIPYPAVDWPLLLKTWKVAEMRKGQENLTAAFEQYQITFEDNGI